MPISTIALSRCPDEFARSYEEWEGHVLIPTGRKRHRPGRLRLGKMLFIMVLFSYE